MKSTVLVTLVLLIVLTPPALSAQQSDVYDPFKIPEKISTCAVLEAVDRVSNGIGFRFELDEDESRGEDRLVDIEFDSAGAPVSLFLVGSHAVLNSDPKSDVVLLKFEPNRTIYSMQIDVTPTSARGLSNKPVAYALRRALDGEEKVRVERFSAWLWSQRCSNNQSADASSH